MRTVFKCDVCNKDHYHPDSAIECEASHYDAHGVCPKCDSSICNFDRLGIKEFVCRECKLIVNCVISFVELLSHYDRDKDHARGAPRYNIKELAWIITTGNGRDKARFYDGPLKEAKPK